MSLETYQPTAITSARSNTQTESVVSFLGNTDLQIFKTPGNASLREISELEQHGVTHSRVVFAEKHPKVVLKSRPSFVGVIRTYQTCIFKQLEQHTYNPATPVWVDYDFTCQASTMLYKPMWADFTTANTKLLTSCKERVVISLTLSGRDHAGILYKQMCLDKIRAHLNSFTSHYIEAIECSYWSAGPMICMTYFYTPGCNEVIPTRSTEEINVSDSIFVCITKLAKLNPGLIIPTGRIITLCEEALGKKINQGDVSSALNNSRGLLTKPHTGWTRVRHGVWRADSSS